MHTTMTGFDFTLSSSHRRYSFLIAYSLLLTNHGPFKSRTFVFDYVVSCPFSFDMISLYSHVCPAAIQILSMAKQSFMVTFCRGASSDLSIGMTMVLA
jgi:hypothetical protein